MKWNFKMSKKNKKIVLYTVTIVFALVYFFFLSDSNLGRHKQLDKKANQLENETYKLQNYINNSYSYDEINKNPKLLEKYAREQLNMKKADEDVFIVEYK